MASTQKTRRIWLCADDYGISPAVNASIRELVLRGRINATSVMTASPHLDGEEAGALEMLNSGQKRVAIGLHVTLTAPFKPLSPDYAPIRDRAFLSLNATMARALTHRLQRERLLIEVAAQMRAFIDAFSHAPDFVDGHQHVHLLPQVRDAVLKVASEAAPGAWVRQSGRLQGPRPLRDRKALVLDVLSLGIRRKAARLGIATNPGFSGAYDFTAKCNFASTFPTFFAGLPDGGLVMCHPGRVDAELEQLDSLTTQREWELTFFNSDEFPRVLAAHGVALASP